MDYINICVISLITLQMNYLIEHNINLYINGEFKIDIFCLKPSDRIG